jgi:aspartyl-tRNA synthetase
VISVSGTVARRSPENVNPSLPTGDIELDVAELEVLAEAQTPPFPIDEEGPVDELLRLRHRTLDLRRERQRDTLILRDHAAKTLRRALGERDFLEIETPMLTRSTPEGARDFLVPARTQPGSFYALPQSPQLFKQLLMMAGFERYFQIVRCFRDEDPRADRQPEFTQLDLEMSFVDEEDVMAVVETVMTEVFAATGFEVPAPPWPRMRYDDAIERYGLDRPDTRFGLEISGLGDVLAGTEFQVFAGALASGGVVRALNAGPRELPRAALDGLVEQAKAWGAKGLVWAFVEEHDAWRSPVAKFLKPEETAAVNRRLQASAGDLLLVVADDAAVAARVLGQLRLELGERFGLVPEDRHEALWIVDFPMFAYHEGERRWDPLHHPFTAPSGDLADPGALRSRAYDVVLDGFEIGGGSIRIHDPDVQRRVFELIGIGPEDAQARFGFLLDALRYGAPPHGGIAMGFDRIVAMLAGWRTPREVNIREAIAFPKTATGADPLTGAPAPVDPGQLRELGLRPLGNERKR